MSFVLLGILNSQAAAGEFDPESLNPDLWLDASDATTITESGGSVSQWNNKGSRANFTQGSSSSQPTTGVTTLNGLNVLDFSADFLTSTSATDYNFMHDGTQYIWVGVYKVTDGIFSRPLGSQGSTGVSIGVRSDLDTRSGNQIFKVNLGNGSESVIFLGQNFTGNEYPVDTFFILSSVIDPDNVTAANRIEYYFDETQGTDVNTYTGTPSASNSQTALDIGAGGDGKATYSGSMAEVIVVSGANATEENRLALVEYLNGKWGAF